MHPHDGERAALSCIDMFASNVSTWGPQARAYLLNCPHSLWVISETHLTPDNFIGVKQDLPNNGWTVHASPAQPKPDSTAKSSSEQGTSGGIMVAARAWLSVAPVIEASSSPKGFIDAIGKHY